MGRRQFGDVGRDLRRDMRPRQAEVIDEGDEARGGGFVGDRGRPAACGRDARGTISVMR
jgi:hypothetical protein